VAHPFMLSAWNVFMSGDEDDRISEVHRERWQPVVDVKSHYDRDNFFRLNQISPMGYDSAAVEGRVARFSSLSRNAKSCAGWASLFRAYPNFSYETLNLFPFRFDI
jgi:hypothetical protein